MRSPHKKSRPSGNPRSSGKGRPAGGSRDGGSRSRIGRPGPALNFRNAFDTLWTKLFTSPVHLDSALAQSPPSVKNLLAPLSRVLLRRPHSLAYYLKFRLSPGEPWEMDPDSIAEWPTARAMADRLQQNYKRDIHFLEGGFAVEEDYPPLMVEEWKRDYGKKTASELVTLLGTEPPLSLRASRRKGTRDEILSKLNDSNELEVRGRVSRVTPFGFYFEDYASVLSQPAFREGQYEIQDEGSQLMSLFALWPEEFLPMLRKVPGHCREWPKEREVPKAPGNWTVIDTCAGAGGKTLAMADAMLGRGQVFAYDVSEKKLASLKQRFRRADLTNIKTALVKEGEEHLVVDKFAGRADRVLVDAPCSGWGVLRRNPDLKWRQPWDSLSRLVDLQERILDAYCPLVKPGGILTFGVCTFRKAETVQQAEAFLERHPEFENIGGGFFGPGPSDGFYLHAFRRKESK